MRRNMITLLKIGLVTGILCGAGYFVALNWNNVMPVVEKQESPKNNGPPDTIVGNNAPPNPSGDKEHSSDKKPVEEHSEDQIVKDDKERTRNVNKKLGSEQADVKQNIQEPVKIEVDAHKPLDEGKPEKLENPVAKDQKMVVESRDEVKRTDPEVEPVKRSTIIHIAVVACGDRLPETLVMLKSALLMSAPSTGFHFHIFADNDLQADFKNQLNTWQAVTSDRAEYTIYDITYPRGDAAEWRKLFKTCATQRIFLPELITKTNHLLYVDTDVLFVSPVEEIWSFFKKFNATQLSALAPEHEDKNTGWYNRFARHPYYPPLGVNSGVMLMRLDMMRDSRWVDYMIDYFKEYRLRTTWGDQDLINIFFHFFPEKLYVYPCEWNYRPDHCMYMSVCKTAETQGVKVLHGSRGVYHNDKQPAFKAVFEAIRDHVFNDDLGKLVSKIKENLAPSAGMPCGRVGHLFTKSLEQQQKGHR